MGSALDFLTGGDSTPAPNLVPGTATLPSGRTASQAYLDSVPPWDGSSRPYALAGSGFAKGVGRTLDMAASPALPDPIASAVVTNAAGGPDWLAPGPVSSGLRTIGATDRPDLVPQTTGEKYLAGISEGVGGSVPLLPLLGPGGVLIGGAGSGAGSTLGRDIGELYGHPEIGSAAGGLIGGGVATPFANLATRGTNWLLGRYNPTGKAYRAAGITPRLTGDVSESPTMRMLQEFGMRNPGSAGRMQRAAQAGLDEFGNAIEQTAAPIGLSHTLEEAGNIAKSESGLWLNSFKSGSSTAWNAVDTAVGPNTPVALSSTRALLNQIKANAGGNSAAEDFLKSPLVKQIEGVLDESEATPGLSGVVPWQTAKALRTRIGEHLENPDLIADAGGAQAKRLWGSFSDDMKRTVDTVPDPNAPELFRLASAYTSKGHDFIENVLSPYLGSGARPSEAAKGLLSTAANGGDVLGALRTEMPRAADELAAFKLRDMGLANPGQQSAAGNAMSPGTFLTDWNRLSPEAKAALYPDTAARTRIDALATVSDHIKRSAQFANHSGTQPAVSIEKMLEGVGMLGGAAGGAALGYGTEGSVLGLLAGEGAGKLAGPVANYGLSYFGANRPLSALMTGRAPPRLFFGQSPAAGGLIGGRRDQAPPPLLGNEP